MLRRIFASLIILSSIVAEGLTGFQGFPQSYLFSLNSETDYSQTKIPGMLLEQAGKDSQGKLFNGLKGLNISMSSMEKGNYWQRMPLVGVQNDIDLSPSFVESDLIPVSICATGEDINLFGSDVSPPARV